MMGGVLKMPRDCCCTRRGHIYYLVVLLLRRRLRVQTISISLRCGGRPQNGGLAAVCDCDVGRCLHPRFAVHLDGIPLFGDDL